MFRGYEAVMAVLAALVNLVISVLCAKALKKSRLLRPKTQASYGTLETCLRLVLMMTAIVVTRWAIGKGLFFLTNRVVALAPLQRPQLNSNILGNAAFSRYLVADVFSYIDR